MKSVLISIRPKWCELIASGKKTVEVRKTRPKLKTPFTCYIYETKGKSDMPTFVDEDGHISYEVGGKVIGEFVCDKIKPILPSSFIVKEDAEQSLSGTCLSAQEAEKYAGWTMKPLIECCNKTLYGWHISHLVIYDKPKEFTAFEKACNRDCAFCKFYYGGGMYEPPSCEWEDFELTRPPQSWCYVEGI